MLKVRIIAAILLILGVLIGFFVYNTENEESKFAFKLGLDLNSGTHLVYRADVSNIVPADRKDSLESLRDVIERRINTFGVSEPLIQLETGNTGTEKIEKLVIELPGITDVAQAIELIGRTPLLEFKLLDNSVLPEPAEDGEEIVLDETAGVFVDTGLTGALLKRAQLTFDHTTGEPTVNITFNSEGRDLFGEITRDNVGETLAIFLDGAPISLPTIRQEIPNGEAVISGGFSAEEARVLVRDLNLGALPVPIELIGTQTIGASLGEEALNKSINAGIWSLILVALFLIFWYRLPGLLSVIALAMYVAIMLALFKLIPVTLTSAGMAGFILSIGMAVDANILIFERMKEELRNGLEVEGAIKEGFGRAWTAIRDSNISSMITAVILFAFASTALIRGFALVFGIGVLVSMLTAITISRTFLRSMGSPKSQKLAHFLFGSGI